MIGGEDMSPSGYEEDNRRRVICLVALFVISFSPLSTDPTELFLMPLLMMFRLMQVRRGGVLGYVGLVCHRELDTAH